MNEIYLDNSATTKICDEALRVYCEVSRENYGNPSSLHSRGLSAEKALKEARDAILSSLKAKDAEVIFTASGSEANNLAIFGRAYSKDRLRHGKIITSDSEHASVNMPLEKLAKEGFTVVKIPTRNGIFDLDAFKRELTPNTVLVSVMAVNNETGAAYDIPAIKSIIKASSAHDALLHIDATQAYLKIPMTWAALGADMMTVSSHKIEGPKGVGALIIDSQLLKRRDLSPIIFGGGQEKNLRSGTENVPAIAAFGAAARLGYKKMGENHEKLSHLHSTLKKMIEEAPSLSEISLTLPEKFSPHILNITLPGIKSETMLHYLSSFGIYVSSGSACSSNSSHRSSALISYGRSEAEADHSIRISFCPQNTEDDCKALCDALKRGLSSLVRIKR